MRDDSLRRQFRSYRKTFVKAFGAFSGLWLCLTLMLPLALSQVEGDTEKLTPGQVPSSRNTPSCTLELTLEGTVAPGTLDYLTRGFQRAEELKCRSILLQVNTPGGSLQTTRLIVEKILSSPQPVLCLISPHGGHAGSAGAIILMACHIAGALPTTNIGAATPIAGGGQAIPEDLRRKLIEDTKSWVVGLAKLRGRNLEFAEKIVTEAKALDAEEAFRLKAIDILAQDKNGFLDQTEGRVVKMAGDVEHTVQNGALVEFLPDLRHAFLQFITDPETAYLIFMASLALIYFEITHPGTMVPGIAGALGLIASLMAFHKLDVWWGGAALIALGIALLIAEAFVASFGALGLGGILALGIGSFLLYEPGVAGGGLSTMLILVVTGVVGAMMMSLAVLALRTRRKGKANTEVVLLGHPGEVASLESPSLRKGMVIVRGEYWRFVSEKDVQIGDQVEVISQEGLVLEVKPIVKSFIES